MIRARELDGRAVIDLDTAEKLGFVDEIYLDPSGSRLAALKATEGASLVGGGRRTIIPAASIASIGPEAIMLRPTGKVDLSPPRIDSLPRLSNIMGRKVVTESGKLLGAIGDVLIEDAGGRIAGFELKDAGWTGGLSNMFGAGRDHRPDYVRSDAGIRLSDELLVVPDGAVVRGRRDAEDTAPAAATTRGSTTRQDTGHASDVTARREADRHTSEHQAPRTTRTAPSSNDTTPQAATRWNDVRAQFRSQWEQGRGARGGIWEEHEPGYRYGWEMGNDHRFQNRPWTDVEPDLQRRWESEHSDRTWMSVHDDVRDGWEATASPEPATSSARSTAPTRTAMQDRGTRAETSDTTRPLL